MPRPSDNAGDLWDLSDMTDDEVRTLVLDQLRTYPELDPGWIDVDVKDGFVTLSGRVGTDSEVQIAEEVIHDVIGIENYSNELVVDELVRGQAPEAADVAVVQEQEVEDQLGEPDMNQSDTAEHLIEDLDGETFGTHDMGKAIQDGIPYVPPDRPVGDGYGSREDH